MSPIDESSNIISSLSSFAWKGGAFFTGIVSVALGMLYVKQDSLLYFPEIGGVPRRPQSNPRRYRNPSEYHMTYENHLIPTSDGATIHCWLLLQQSHRHDPQSKIPPTIIFFHGNAGNIGLRLPNAAQMYHKLQANVAMIEYRGFGDSSDHPPTESGLKLDSEAALHFIASYMNEKYNYSTQQSHLFIFGRSLGGAVGFHLADYAERVGIPLSGLIVENTFLSIGKMVDVLMPMIAMLKTLILRINWDSEAIAKSLYLPVLYLAGESDELVPHSHMRILYDHSKKSSILPRIHIIRDGRHNESWLQGGNLYWEKINDFINETQCIQNKKSTNQSCANTEQSKSSQTSLETSIRKTLDDDNKNTTPMESKTGASHSSSLAVRLGMEVDTGSDASSNRLISGIPIMPGNLMGMARETVIQQKKAKES